MDDTARRAPTTVLPPPPDPSTEPSPAADGGTGMGLASIRVQAEEHPVIDDGPAATPAEHCLRLMHLKAYDEAARLASGSDVLDIGCNTGYGTMAFVDVARRVVGVDVSAKAIEVARSTAVDGRPEFEVIDGLTLPFPDDSFDLVVSFQVIEHIEDPVPYLREIKRVARPGATILFTTPNAGTRLYPGMTPWNRFHVREYLAPELDALLRRVFDDVRVRGMFGTPTLYETEIWRVDAARVRIRKAEQAKFAPPMPAAPPLSPRRRRPLPFRVARALVPGRVRGWLRRTLVEEPARSPARRTSPVPVAMPAVAAADLEPLPLERFLEFTVDDLFYADRDLDRAMDFMGVCRA